MQTLLQRKYGNNNTNNDNNSDERDAMPSHHGNKKNDPKKGLIVGSVSQDKAKILGDEFDLLFGQQQASNNPIKSEACLL